MADKTEKERVFVMPTEKIYRQLVINPGSTSTKLAVYENESCVFTKKIEHNVVELEKFARITDQFHYRLEMILQTLAAEGINLATLHAVVGRGGILGPMESGTYLVNERMKRELVECPREEHVSNLGALIADEIARKVGIPSYIVDPVCTDELDEVARLTGLPDLEKYSFGHVLNIKAVARKVAARLGRRLEQCNFVVAHLGSGISIAALRKGKIVDINGATQEGPFSPERCGGLPTMQFMQLCYSGKYSYEEMYNKLTKSGGMFAYLGTKDIREAEDRAAHGDEDARLVLEAMAYQIAKEIGAMAVVLEGIIDRIVVTGGIAHSQFVTSRVIKRVKFIGPVDLVPGEEELEALALGGLRVLRGEEKPKEYGKRRKTC